MQKSNLWKFIGNELKQQNNVCLIIMVHAEGHGPNRPGAKLAISSNNNRIGTVGGGMAEASLSIKAKEMLTSGSKAGSEIITMSHNTSAANKSGMICSGVQTFLLTIITPDKIDIINRIISIYDNAEKTCLLITDKDIILDRGKNATNISWCHNDNNWCYTEYIGEHDTVYLIGGGHVALALSRILAMLDFRITILDNRKELDTMQANKHAQQCIFADYNNIRDYIPVGAHSYVCIMTHGHKFDELVLKHLIEYPLKYLGLMGSPAKIKTIKENLEKSGISRESLETVYTPIGIPINSNTPAEIAISIAAQLIQVKNSLETTTLSC